MRMAVLFSITTFVAPAVCQAQFYPSYTAARQAVVVGPIVGPAVVLPAPVVPSYRYGQTVVGPFGGSRTLAYRGGAYVNPDGSTVQYSTSVEAARGPFGYGGAVRRDQSMLMAPSGNGYVYSSTTSRSALAPPVPVLGMRRTTTTTSVVGPYGSYRRSSTFISH